MEDLNDYSERLKAEMAKSLETKVKIGLFGKSGIGKSSIINRLTGQNLAVEGVKTNTTLDVKSYDWNGLTLVDLPGYSTTAFKTEGYINKFSIKDFDIILCAFGDRILHDDSEQYKELMEFGKICIYVRNKLDTIKPINKRDRLKEEIHEDLEEQIGKKVKLYFVTSVEGEVDGYDELIKAIEAELTPVKKERWIRAAKAYSKEFLDEKQKISQKDVTIYSGLAAVNGINPIPGLDIGVDIALLLKLFMAIKNNYGLSEDVIKNSVFSNPYYAGLIQNIVKSLSKDGLVSILKRYAVQEGTKEVAKYIPFVGQAIAAMAGFAITRKAGMSYLDDCHKIGEKILKDELERVKNNIFA